MLEIVDIKDQRITYYESEEDWAADRHGCGATTAYKLLELCPASWGGAWSVWAAHHLDSYEQEESTSVMRAGLVWERYVLSWYDDNRLDGDDDLHLDVQTCRVEAQVRGLPLRPSPDALIWDNDRIIGGVEVKCPRYGWDDYAKDLTLIDQWQNDDELDMPLARGWLGRRREDYPAPLHYVAQVYLTMAALRSAGHEVEYWDLVVSFGPHDTRVITFMWDEVMARRLLKMLIEAWFAIVDCGQEPAPDQTRAAFTYLLTRPRRKPVVRLERDRHPDLCADVMEYVNGHKADSEWQKTKRALRPGILEQCAQFGSEGLEVQVLNQVYRVKVTSTGRFYPKLITTKDD